MEPQSWESSIISFLVFFMRKIIIWIDLNEELELGKNIIEREKKWLKLKRLVFYLTGTKLQR